MPNPKSEPTIPEKLLRMAREVAQQIVYKCSWCHARDVRRSEPLGVYVCRKCWTSIGGAGWHEMQYPPVDKESEAIARLALDYAARQRAEENEACAKVCERLADDVRKGARYGSFTESAWREAAEHIRFRLTTPADGERAK